MKTIGTNKLTLAFLLFAAAGCAAQVPANPNDDDDDDADEPLPDDVQMTGKYKINSSVDLAQNAPGKAGEIVRAIVEATDDPDDPTKWILDQIIANVDSGWARTALETASGLAAGYLNEKVLEFAPDFVTSLKDVGEQFGDATKTFGLSETLEISGSPGNYTATHTVLGARFKLDNMQQEYLFTEYGGQAISVPGVGLTIEPASNKLSIKDHEVPLAYGRVLRIALDGAIIPAVDGTAKNLGELLQHKVNCERVGEIVNDAIKDQLGFGVGSSVFRTACNKALTKVADTVYAKLGEMDGEALKFGINGNAKVLDRDGDETIDTIQTGTWAGTLSYAGTPNTLTGATFFGARM